jgi:hypothetical protein
MSFRITGLSPEPFRPLFGLPDEELARHHAKRITVPRTPGYPDRIEVRDTLPGESVLLVNYVHQPADTPFRASHAIFVCEGAERPYDAVDEIPDSLRIRPISLRAFSADHYMIDADVVDGFVLDGAIERFFGNRDVAYLHAHYARQGCYAARVDRA